MYAKTAILALAATMASAVAVPEPEAATPVLAARASSTPSTGAVLFYSKAKYTGSNAVIDVDQGETEFCTRFSGPSDLGASFGTIGSYIAAYTSCITFPSDDCSGNATGTITSGQVSSANIKLGSLACAFENQ